MTTTTNDRTSKDRVCQHFIQATPSNLNCFLDSTIKPILYVNSDELIDIETIDCFGGRVRPKSASSRSSSSPDLVGASAVTTNTENPWDIPKDRLNPVTGPIFVKDAEAGDWLAVTLHNIRPDPRRAGIACCGPHSGQLSHRISNPTTRFFDITYHENDENGGDYIVGCTGIYGRVTMREIEDEHSGDTSNISSGSMTKRRCSISFPLRPMLGIVAVAPSPSLGKVSTMPAGTHGGNLDNKMNGIGSTIYLPVSNKGALLSVGDMHASQGDGEISGTGVEVGGLVTLSCRVVKQKDLFSSAYGGLDDDGRRPIFPVTETSTHWMTHGVVVENIPQATNVACDEAAKLLVGQWGFSYEEAFIFLSVRGELGLCQSCHPDKGTQIARMMVEKLSVCPRPFRFLLGDNDNHVKQDETR